MEGIRASWQHPGRGNKGMQVCIGKIGVTFSYNAVVGFWDETGSYWSENLWGTTTGGHISAAPKDRMKRSDFEVEFKKFCKRHKL